MKFWKVVPVFAQKKKKKKSCNLTLEIVNFMYSSGLGYCIKGVAGRKATGEFEKKKKLFSRNWKGWCRDILWCRDLAEVRTEGSLVAT